MLNIITGLPGACKTLYTLSKILPQCRGRRIYVHGIPGIDHEHFGTEELKNPEKWYEMEEGSVIIIDEAQGTFPLRKAGSPVPRKCSEFETHRHRGFDIHLITQDATTLDVHIRKLAGGHIHCKRLFGSQTSTIFVYGKYQPKPEDRNTIRAAISSNVWPFDRKIFDHYKSADLHTVKRKIPFKLLMVPALVLLGIAGVWWSVSTIYAMFSDDAESVESALESGILGGDVSSPGEVTYTKAEDWLLQRTPVVDGMPWTAPIYADVFKVSTFPKPICVIIELSVGRDCRCYTQQITRLEDVDTKICFHIASKGWFDPTKSDKRNRERATRAPADENLARGRSTLRRGQTDEGFGKSLNGDSVFQLRPPPTTPKYRDRDD